MTRMRPIVYSIASYAIKKSLTAIAVTAALLIISITCFSFIASTLPSKYTYYGKVPDRIIIYRPVDWRSQPACQNPYEWEVYSGPNTLALLAIVSGKDDVNVEIYNLTFNQLIVKATLKRLEPLYLLLKNGTFFKVVADSPVTVQLINYNETPVPGALGPTIHGFYYSTEGLYVGKEFVFIAVQGSLTGNDYAVLAVERSEVTIERDDGFTVTFKLNANEYKFLPLTPFRVYRIRSTGNIMVMSGTIPGIGTYETTSFAIPSVEGGFQGTFFIVRAFRAIEWGWDTTRDYGFRVLALENTRISVYDLETGNKIGDYLVPGGAGIQLRPNAHAVALVSERPVSFWFLHNGSIEIENAGMHGGRYCGYPRSTMFFTLRPNEDTIVQFPSNASLEVYFYAKEDTEVLVDDTIVIRLKADTPYLFTVPGIHKVRASKEVLVQVNSWPRHPPYQGLMFTGAVIPPLETASVKPEVEIEVPGTKAAFSPILIAGISAAAVVAAILLMLRRRKK
ncbi:MAG: hypothetical protein QXE66_04250 [Desulfurococcaceae archaeon]